MSETDSRIPILSRITNLFRDWTHDEKLFHTILIILELAVFSALFYLTNILGIDRLFTETAVLIILLILLLSSLILVFVQFESHQKNADEQTEKLKEATSAFHGDLDTYLKKSADTIREGVLSVEKISAETKECVSELSNKTKNYIDYAKNHHITIVSSEKELEISKEKLKNGQCFVRHTMKIRNNGSQQFERYIYWIASSLGTSDIDGYEIYVDDSGPIDEKRGRTHQHLTKTYDDCKTSDEYKISIPMKIRPSSTKTLKICEKSSPSFNELKTCLNDGNDADDWLAITINYPTEVLRFTLKLNEDMTGYQFRKKDQYCAKSNILHTESSITDKAFIILDQSEQQVKHEQDSLINWGAVPEYHLGSKPEDGYKEVTWEIHYPKIGYRYQLCFTLAKTPGKKTEEVPHTE